MASLFEHKPDLNGEDGTEYPWSVAIGKIKLRKAEWQTIEQQLDKKKVNQEQREQFLENIMNALINIKTERFLNRNHDKYDDKEELLSDLKKIRDRVCALQKDFWHREYHDILNSHLSNILEPESIFELEENKKTHALQGIEEGLQQMRVAADKAINHYAEKKELRPDFSTFKKNLKQSLAFLIADELHKIGIRPTETRNGVFDTIFQCCCIITDKTNLSTKAGSSQVVAAAKKYKNTKSLPKK